MYSSRQQQQPMIAEEENWYNYNSKFYDSMETKLPKKTVY